MTRRVTLLTDFGSRDGYVGAMKGVIAAAAPDALLDDVSHEVARGDVLAGAYALARYWRLYPEGTVHLAVVDPGVGGARQALALEADGRFVVAPDNGLVSRALDGATAWRAVDLSRVRTPEAVATGRSSTFHGRDVFAPAAGALASGRPLEALGEPAPHPLRIPEPRPTRDAGAARGVVVAVDRFGNLLTNVPGGWLTDGAGPVEVAGEVVPLRSTYVEATPGGLLALVSSDGRLEIAVRDGSAAERLGAGAGAGVRVRLPE